MDARTLNHQNQGQELERKELSTWNILHLLLEGMITYGKESSGRSLILSTLAFSRSCLVIEKIRSVRMPVANQALMYAGIVNNSLIRCSSMKQTSVEAIEQWRLLTPQLPVPLLVRSCYKRKRVSRYANNDTHERQHMQKLKTKLLLSSVTAPF